MKQPFLIGFVNDEKGHEYKGVWCGGWLALVCAHSSTLFQASPCLMSRHGSSTFQCSQLFCIGRN